jgi:hypothetical protein
MRLGMNETLKKFLGGDWHKKKYFLTLYKNFPSMRMSRATLEMDRSIFGLGLFLGAVVIRHGFDQGCVRDELFAINDTPLYHTKVIPVTYLCYFCLF